MPHEISCDQWGALLIDGLSVQHGERCLPQGDDFGTFLRDFVSWLPQIGLLFIKRPKRLRAPSFQVPLLSADKLIDPLDVNLLLAFAGLGDIVRSLHTHQRVHLHAESLFHA